MPDVLTFPDGGYRFIKGVFQYSAGVAAEPGWEIVRARLAKPLPLAEDPFAAPEAPELAAAGRGVLRLRITIAQAVQRCRLPRVQSQLRRAADAMGDHKGRHQPHRAQQCLP